jgi:Tol biopolymer transport system component
MLLSIALVSVNAAGTAPGNSISDFGNVTYGGPPGGGTTESPQANLSTDGTKLVFVSEATDLVGSLKDTNHASDVFVRDMTTGQTSLVSATPGGQTGNGDSFSPVISPDGRYVAFLSQATNLSSVSAPSISSPDPTSGYLYVRDLQTGTTTLLDQTLDGQASDGWSTGQFVFSPDSKSLAFIDTSDNLTSASVDPGSGSSSIPGWRGPSPAAYVYVRDLAGQSTSLVSISTDGMASGSTPIEGPSSTTDLVFSPDSRSLVFGSTATDLTSNPPDNSPNPYPGMPFGSQNLFLRDLSAATTTLISVTTDGSLAASDSYGATFSPDGHSVVFSSAATNLTTNASDAPSSAGSSNPYGPNGPSTNLFLRDLTTGTTTLVSATPGGLSSNGLSDTPIFSPDGKSLAFLSTATDLTNAQVDSSPMPGDPSSPGSAPVPSPADNLFVEDLTTGKITAVSTTPSGQLSNGEVNELEYSPDGRFLAFVSNANDLTKNAAEPAPPPPAPVPGTPAVATDPIGPPMIANVFVRDLQTGTTTLADV